MLTIQSSARSSSSGQMSGTGSFFRHAPRVRRRDSSPQLGSGLLRDLARPDQGEASSHPHEARGNCRAWAGRALPQLSVRHTTRWRPGPWLSRTAF